MSKVKSRWKSDLNIYANGSLRFKNGLCEKGRVQEEVFLEAHNLENLVYLGDTKIYQDLE